MGIIMSLPFVNSMYNRSHDKSHASFFTYPSFVPSGIQQLLICRNRNAAKEYEAHGLPLTGYHHIEIASLMATLRDRIYMI